MRNFAHAAVLHNAFLAAMNTSKCFQFQFKSPCSLSVFAHFDEVADYIDGREQQAEGNAQNKEDDFEPCMGLLVHPRVGNDICGPALYFTFPYRIRCKLPCRDCAV